MAHNLAGLPVANGVPTLCQVSSFGLESPFALGAGQLYPQPSLPARLRCDRCQGIDVVIMSMQLICRRCDLALYVGVPESQAPRFRVEAEENINLLHMFIWASGYYVIVLSA
eukprot:scaffold25589_cov34-Prasinocladus_malaysianus.AAC.1